MNYSEQDIIKIAVRIEENGYAFYSTAASMITEENEIRKLFLDLAEEETMHIAVFRQMLELSGNHAIVMDNTGDASALPPLTDAHIFGKPDTGKALAETITTPREGLEFAFRFENDSINFYSELLKHTHPDAQPLVQQIIDEEKEHAAYIRKFIH